MDRKVRGKDKAPSLLIPLLRRRTFITPATTWIANNYIKALAFTNAQFARTREKRNLRFVDLLKRARLAYAFSEAAPEITFRSRLSQGSQTYSAVLLSIYGIDICLADTTPKSISHYAGECYILNGNITVRQSNYLWIALREPIERRLHSIEIIASPPADLSKFVVPLLRFINFVFDAEARPLACAELRFLVHFLRFVNRWLFLLKSRRKWKSNKRKAENGYTFLGYLLSTA